MNPSAPEPKSISADELVRKSLEGDLGSFRLLMESHEHYCFVLALRLLHDEDDVKDIVQDAFIRVWNNLAAYRPEVKFTTWLYKIVVNLCYDKMKMERRRKNVFGYLVGVISPGDVPDSRDLQTEIEHTDLRDHILAAARRLPPMENLVFHLRDVQDFSIQEIAEIAGISIGSVKTNLCYARKRLRIAVTKMQESEQQ